MAGHTEHPPGLGTAVLIISEDLDEVMTVSDRVLVMYEGTIIGSADPRTATREEIGMMMAGVRPEAPAPGVSGVTQ